MLITTGLFLPFRFSNIFNTLKENCSLVVFGCFVVFLAFTYCIFDSILHISYTYFHILIDYGYICDSVFKEQKEQ